MQLGKKLTAIAACAFMASGALAAAFPAAATASTTGESAARYYYGAIAVSRDGDIGRSWDYGTEATAKRRALRECGHSSCKVLTTFVNGCGAVAYNSKRNVYWGGRGSTPARAKRNAIANAGGGRWIAYQCTKR
ncbi:DUF4189 domain-containing protein [Planomonospora venezuelensis]|uniref:DUF4189 domain-containing protein n=1 Tax=Planomonospora venezuelensis TaxID=1999 RepID=A0A841CY94_PLAVE|nr:DUF4189 domain-containing protein [Planomonospora venezuelensis]MBB5960957.1 hypothetical protein [Planomonospora venezuelensis]GIN01190.1 hypothetical protein Pve01_28480 [Planomonospora venezuelensis]